MVILPHSVTRSLNDEDITQFLQSRWEEHLAESLLLSDHPQGEGVELQLALIKHQQERAQHEADMYADVLKTFGFKASRDEYGRIIYARQPSRCLQFRIGSIMLNLRCLKQLSNVLQVFNGMDSHLSRIS